MEEKFKKYVDYLNYLIATQQKVTKREKQIMDYLWFYQCIKKDEKELAQLKLI